MYETRFGFRRRPFPAAPDSRSYYPATTHERTLALLQRALADGEGTVLLTGGPGTGKTLVCHCLLERLGPGVASAFLTNSHFGGRADLLQAILYELSLPYTGGTEQDYRLRLTDFLLRNYQEGRGAVIVVDEAQHLAPDLLEELRLLGNLEADGGRAVQVILAGQDGLLETLRRPELAAFSQRVSVRARLEPLGVAEAVDYLLHHLRAAGARPERIVSEDALELLARQTGGVPRLLNQAAHQALALADAADSGLMDAEAALEALALLGLDGEATAGEEAEFAPAEDEGSEEAAGAEAVAIRRGVTVGGTAVEEAEDGRGCRLFEVPRRPA